MDEVVSSRLPFGAYRRLLAVYVGPQRGRVLRLGVLLMGGIALQLINPQIIRRFLDAAQAGAGGAPMAGVAPAGLAFVAIGLLQSAANWAAVYAGEDLGWRATNALRDDLTRHVLRLDLTFHKQHTPGELIQRIDGDAAALGNFFSHFTLRLLGSGALIAGILVLLYAEDWRLGLSLSVYAGLTLVALGFLQRLAAPRWARLRQAEAALDGYIEERYNATEDIRSVGAEAAARDGLRGLMAEVTRHGVAAQFSGALAGGATALLYLAGYLIGLALGAYLYLQGAVSIGGAYIVVYYVGMLAAPLEAVRSQVQDLGRASATVTRVAWLFEQRSALVEAGQATLPAGALAVELDRVAFAYRDLPDPGESVARRGDPRDRPAEGDRDDRPYVEQAEFALDGITFRLQPGRVLGLLGRTGSGKTTLTSLLFRLYDPTGGSIRLGGVDLRDLALDDLRRRVGLITQDVQLYHASIRDNLAFFNPRVGDAQLAGALAELGLWAWVNRLPAGLDTVLGPGGVGLSAGEAQLLAFARVFLKDPGLVVLDEASARLDPATERLLEAAVQRLLAGRTGIVIAHRLATVRRADEILIMARGRVIEHGPRDALAADPDSRFSALLRTGMEEALA